MSTLEATVPEFRIGNVLGRAFSILIKNFVPFGLLSLAVLLPAYVFAVVAEPTYFLKMTNPMSQTENVWLDAAVGIAESLLGYIVTAAIVFGTFQELRGHHADLGDCIRRGLALILPVVGIAILVGLSVGIGTILFVIPGFIMMTMFWVAIPVAVVERPGVGASLSRSMALTSGYRWRIFGLVLILYVILLAIGVGLALVLGILADSFSQTALIWGGLILNLVVMAFFTALSAVVSTVGYHDLRAVKEGIDVDQIAAVFD